MRLAAVMDQLLMHTGQICRRGVTDYLNSKPHQCPKSGLPCNLTTGMEFDTTAILFANS